MNPFIVIGYEPGLFCDRERETETLVRSLNNKRNICIVSPRRLGKTALIRHVFALQKKWICVGTALANVLQANKLSLLQILTSLKFSVEADPLTGNFNVGFNLVKPGDSKRSVSELLQVLSKQKKVVVAFDEFQQILSFPDAQVEGWLRSEAQQYNEIRFIFSGSHQRVLNEMFASSKRPFYHSAELMKLDCIDKSVYSKFIVHHFKQGRKKISTQTADFIYDYCFGFTAYIQQICNHLYDLQEKHISETHVLRVVGDLLKQYEPFYLKLRKPLTAIQFRAMIAIARMKKVYAITGNEFMRQAKMTNASSASKTINTLLKNDLVYADIDDNGKEFYSIDDVLFMRWLERYY
jgi:uncharacterized protein